MPTNTNIRKQYRKEFRDAWHAVEELFDPELVFGKKGYQFVLTHAIRTSNHPFVVGMTLLGSMCPLMNGAAVRIFPGSVSPLNVLCILINYPQTRKSQHTKIIKIIGDALDKHVLDEAEAAVKRLLDEDEDSGADGRHPDENDNEPSARADAAPERPSKRPRLQVASSTISCFTPEAFFERFSGDYPQIQNAADVGAEMLSGSLHFGRMANPDEAYAQFSAFGFTHDDSRRGGAAGALAVNQHAGAVNRLLQYGECSKTTRSRGSFGTGSTPPVSSAFMGNMHPEVWVPMDRGEIGNHVGATKERILAYTAEPVQPHSPLPSEYDVPSGHNRWTWAELDEDMAELCGLSDLLADPVAAGIAADQGILEHVSAEEIDNDSVEEDETLVCVPDANGYKFTLPDGVESRLRYTYRGDVPVAEFRVGNRDIPLPEGHDLAEASQRVLHFFRKSHAEIDFDDFARKLLATVKTHSAVKATLASEGADDDAAARWGNAPWKTGLLAGMFSAWDVFVNQHEFSMHAETNTLMLDRTYVARARSIYKVLEALRSCWGPGHAPDSEHAVEQLARAAQSLDFQAGVDIADASPLGMAPFPATQLGVPRATAAPVAPPSGDAQAGTIVQDAALLPATQLGAGPGTPQDPAAPLALPADDDSAVHPEDLFAPWPAPGHSDLDRPLEDDDRQEDVVSHSNGGPGGADLQALPDASHSDALPALLAPIGGISSPVASQAAAPSQISSDDVPPAQAATVNQPDPYSVKGTDQAVAMDVGYGSNGVSVQLLRTDETEPLMSDRLIMKITVMEGRPRVEWKSVKNKLRDIKEQADGSKKRLTVTKSNWETVVKAAFEQYPVGELQNAGLADATACFFGPPSQGDGRDRIVYHHNLLMDLCQVSGRGFRQKLVLWESKQPRVDGENHVAEVGESDAQGGHQDEGGEEELPKVEEPAGPGAPAAQRPVRPPRPGQRGVGRGSGGRRAARGGRR